MYRYACVPVLRPLKQRSCPGTPSVQRLETGEMLRLLIAIGQPEKAINDELLPRS